MYKSYDFDRFLRYEELAEWLNAVAGVHPDLVTIETYGQSFEGRDLLIATITDSSTGSHDTKPAHWIDASIHAVELTATVAACRVLQRLVDGFTTGDEQMVRALQTRTFYIVPRVNPDDAEWAMADTPKFRRSSVRPWPLADGHRMPGHLSEDIDGDGRILVPEEFRDHAGLGETATFAGLGKSFQIWEPEAHAGRREASRAKIRDGGLSLPLGPSGNGGGSSGGGGQT